MRFGKAWVVGGAASVLGAAAMPMLSAATPNAHIVRIGLEAPMTGSQSSIGIGMLRGAVLAADQINARGGVIGPNGKPGYLIKVVKIDDAAEPGYGRGGGQTGDQRRPKRGRRPIQLGCWRTDVAAVSQGGPRAISPHLGECHQPSRHHTAADDVPNRPVASQALTKWLKAKSVAVIYDSTTSYTTAEAEAVMVRLRESRCPDHRLPDRAGSRQLHRCGHAGRCGETERDLLGRVLPRSGGDREGSRCGARCGRVPGGLLRLRPRLRRCRRNHGRSALPGGRRPRADGLPRFRRWSVSMSAPTTQRPGRGRRTPTIRSSSLRGGSSTRAPTSRPRS